GDADDEPYVVALPPATGTGTSQSVPPFTRSGSSAVVQRVANFKAGAFNATTDLAPHILGGRRDMGFTPPTLNGTAALTVAAVQGAIKPPVLSGQSNADGTATAWVDKVDTNEASFTGQVPNNGPWSTNTTKAAVAAVFASLKFPAKAACTGPDAS